MGQVTPNISIYIPSAGETNYDTSFSTGMVNIDQHDHSGGPQKGVLIAATGLANNSVTYQKLNANVVDTTTGLGLSGALPNQIVITGILKNLNSLATPAGFIAKDGAVVTARTITGTANQIAVADGDGIAANPTLSIAAPLLIPTNPAFKAYANVDITDVTGDTTIYTILWAAEAFDKGGNFAVGTDLFTAPVTGIYPFNVNLILKDIAAGHTAGVLTLVSSGGPTELLWSGNPAAIAVAGVLAIQGSAVLNLTAAQTVSCTLMVSGGAKDVDIKGGAVATGPSSFSGFLLN